MENKIQALTEKIYHEGVEKGKEEAQKIVETARKEAAQLMENAKAEAEAMLNAARKEAADTAAHTQSEIKMFGAQAVNALKSEIASMLTNQLADKAAKALTNDQDFMKQFVLNLAKNWTADEQIVISSADANALKEYFAKEAQQLLDKGMKIAQVNGQKAAFSIAPANGSYKINFGEKEFMEYFSTFLRPQLVKLLFNAD